MIFNRIFTVKSNTYGLHFSHLLLLFSSSLFIIGCDSGLAVKDSKPSHQWYAEGEASVLKRQENLKEVYSTTKHSNNGSSIKKTQKAKNIIFVLGDGMGVSTLTAARIFVGQQKGLLGEEYDLSFEQFPYSALIKTYNVDLQTPDSAGTMSALMTGVKTNEGIISLPDSVSRGVCQESKYQSNRLPTLIDHAKSLGKSTAMVTTARVTHATPATTYAHSSDRNWESDESMPKTAKEAGCHDIASQWVDAEQSSLDVLLGGGRRHFLPKAQGGKRLDQRDLIQGWQEKGHYVATTDELLALVESNVIKKAGDEKDLNGKFAQVTDNKPWLGLFSSSHMEYAHQRPAEQPSLQQMTSAALKRLEQNNEGYALIIESGRIDHGHHAGIAYKALTETQELHETVAWLLTQVDLTETLIVVTADHSHTLTLAGYTTRGNPILGNVVGNDSFGNPQKEATMDQIGRPYTSLSYRDGPGAISMREQGYKDVHADDYQQMALVPMDYETHGGEDVALYAIGPQSQLFSGTLEQHWVFHALKYAMQK